MPSLPPRPVLLTPNLAYYQLLTAGTVHISSARERDTSQTCWCRTACGQPMHAAGQRDPRYERVGSFAPATHRLCLHCRRWALEHGKLTFMD